MILAQILKHLRPTYTGGFQIINSCICGASTLLKTKENKIYKLVLTKDNSPFLSSKYSHFWHKAKCKTYLVKISFTSVELPNKKSFL